MKRFSLALDDIKKLIDVGKEKGYLAYNEVNDLIPHDVHSSEDLDDLLTTVSTQALTYLKVRPGCPPRPSKTGLKRKWRPARTSRSTCPEAFLKRQSIRRIYLREMGTVSLLAREGEVDIAKRIERGELVAVADYESERG